MADKKILLGDEEKMEKLQKEEVAKRAEEKKDQPEEVSEDSSPNTPKSSTPRPPKQRGKKYQDAKKKVDEDKAYSLEEAVNELKKLSYVKFDESVELHLNVAEKGLRGEVNLPHETGKTVRIEIMDDAVLEKIESGDIDFDVLISHPRYMSKLARHARVLGPKGLMPNPKAGTISTEPEKVAEKFRKGTLRWKTEPKFPLIHQMIAKLSQDTKEIVENAESFIESVGKKNIEEAHITATMTPGMKVKLEEETE